MENEKQILMERVKKQYTAGLKLNGKWGIIVDFLIWVPPVGIMIERVISHGFTPKDIAISCCIALAMPLIIYVEYRKKFWYSRCNNCQSAQVFLETIDKSGKEISMMLALLLMGVGIIITTYLCITHEFLRAGIVATVAAAFTVVMVVIKPRQTKDIKRLRQIVNQNDDDSCE